MENIHDITTKEIPEINTYKSYESGFREKHLTPDNYEQFTDEIESLISNMDSDVKNNIQDALKIAKKIDMKTNEPTIKSRDWSDNLWYGLFQDQQAVIDRFVTASLYKTWMIKFLSIYSDKLYELTTVIKKKINEIEKIKAERDLFDKMTNSLESERQRYHKLTQDRIIQLNDETNRVKEAINKLIIQMELLSQKVELKQSENIPKLSDLKQSETNIIVPSDSKIAVDEETGNIGIAVEDDEKIDKDKSTDEDEPKDFEIDDIEEFDEMMDDL